MYIGVACYHVKKLAFGLGLFTSSINMSKEEFIELLKDGLVPCGIFSGKNNRSCVIDVNQNTITDSNNINTENIFPDYIIINDNIDLRPYFSHSIDTWLSKQGLSQPNCTTQQVIDAYNEKNNTSVIEGEYYPKKILNTEQYKSKFITKSLTNGEAIFERSSEANLGIIINNNSIIKGNRSHTLMIKRDNNIIIQSTNINKTMNINDIEVNTELGLHPYSKDHELNGITKILICKLPRIDISTKYYGIIPGDMYQLPELNMDLVSIDKIIEENKIPKTSKLRKHEKVQHIIEWMSKNVKDDSVPRLYQITVVPDVKLFPTVKTLSISQYLYLISKSIAINGGIHLIGSNKFPCVSERISTEGGYPEAILTIVDTHKEGYNMISSIDIKSNYSCRRSEL